MDVIWDEAKNLANQRKHGVSFEEASALFRSGANYLEIFDDEHSVGEDRFIAIGPIRGGLVLIIWTERDEKPYGSLVRAGRRRMSRTSTIRTWTKCHD